MEMNDFTDELFCTKKLTNLFMVCHVEPSSALHVHRKFLFIFIINNSEEIKVRLCKRAQKNNKGTYS